MIGDAVFSGDGRYRYALTREWDASCSPVVFIMLNPSTADAAKDDPTVRRCIAFAKSWGYGGLIVLNIFAFRSTDPALLYNLTRRNAAGDDNAEHILALARDRDCVAAWGSHGALYNRGQETTANVAPVAARLDCLGVTANGQPKHPLYIEGTRVRKPWGVKT